MSIKNLYILLFIFLSSFSYASCKSVFESKFEKVTEKITEGGSYTTTKWVLKQDTEIRGVLFKKGTSFHKVRGYFNRLEEEIRKSVF